MSLKLSTITQSYNLQQKHQTPIGPFQNKNRVIYLLEFPPPPWWRRGSVVVEVFFILEEGKCFKNFKRYFGLQCYKVFGQKFSLYRFNFVLSFSEEQNRIHKCENLRDIETTL